MAHLSALRRVSGSPVANLSYSPLGSVVERVTSSILTQYYYLNHDKVVSSILTVGIITSSYAIGYFFLSRCPSLKDGAHLDTQNVIFFTIAVQQTCARTCPTARSVAR